MSSPALPASLRAPVVAGLLVAAAAHVPVIPQHLREAPYMGALFVAFTVVAAVVAGVLAVRGSSVATAGAGLLCAAAIGAYCLTRMIAFPQLADDVGNWGEPLGVVSIVSEGVVVLLAMTARLSRPIVLARA